MQNCFGEARVLEPESLEAPIYIECTACLSVFSEWWEWAEDHQDRVTRNSREARSILVLGCQVTDLAVLNDLRTAERLARVYPFTPVYMGGCLARRFDIPLPYTRVVLADDGRETAGVLRDRTLVHWQDPFWIPRFQSDTTTQANGNQFRHDYPIRIGRGCKGKCAFCTINATRGSYREYRFDSQVLADHPGAVIVGDSPTALQVVEVLSTAIVLDAPVKMRNIEPEVALKTAWLACIAAEKGVLAAWHCPIQSTNPDVVRAMRRNPEAMKKVLELAVELCERGVWTATNVIYDFLPGDTSEDAEDYFSHVAWNPYWDGKWDREKAEQRWEWYLGKPWVAQ